MKNISEEEAKKKVCPFLSERTTSGGGGRFCYCLTSNCMAWVEVHSKESREDHSGGKEMMWARAADTQRLSYLRREGGYGSSGKWVIDAVGHCGRVE